MIQSISDYSNHYKTWFLLFGLVSILFCFFLDVAEYEFKSTTTTIYLTFSGRQHTSSDEADCFFKLTSCYGSICNIVKATPYLGGFALGFGILVLLLQSGIDTFSRYLKKVHNKILQLVCLFLSFVLMLIIPILYLATDIQLYSLCWFAIFLEFLSTFMLTIAAILYIKANNMGGIELSQTQ